VFSIVEYIINYKLSHT